jgi:ribonuclease HII
LAGPVTVAAVAVPASGGRQVVRPSSPRVANGKLRDSKKLTAKQRAEWFAYIKKRPDIFYAIAHVSPGVIDRINISAAANLAATRAFRRLMANSEWQVARGRSSIRLFLDGGLYVDEKLLTAYRLRLTSVQTVVRADEKYSCVKLASIVAKVVRDNYMTKKHKIFPQYCFNRHKGYGTERHRRAIKKHGSSLMHRLTFLKRFRTIS